MHRLARDGTVEPVLCNQILIREKGQRGIFIFPVQLTTSSIGNLNRLITLAICDDHTYYIHTHTYTASVRILLYYLTRIQYVALVITLSNSGERMNREKILAHRMHAAYRIVTRGSGCTKSFTEFTVTVKATVV